VALILVLAFLVVQVITGIVTGSLALLSDAGHMATDAVGLGMALAAIHLAARPEQRSYRTFGLYRLEILAALANAGLLFAVAGYVLVEAVRRLGDPPDIDAAVVLVVGGLGLAVNIAGFLLLRGGASENLNVKAAYTEVLADLMGSVGVVVAALLMLATGWGWVDPVIGAAIGIFILPRAWALGAATIRILVQAAPAGVDLDSVRADLTSIPGVVDVHDLHVWTLTSDMDVATAHVMVRAGSDAHAVLDQARDMLASRHGLAHATLQVEPDDHHGCEDVEW
jgi:cobalt-zinc-cadmium efflux system protein